MPGKGGDEEGEEGRKGEGRKVRTLPPSISAYAPEWRNLWPVPVQARMSLHPTLTVEGQKIFGNFLSDYLFSRHSRAS